MKRLIKESIKYSDFSQWFKLRAWMMGFKDEKKLEDLAYEVYNYFKIN